MARTPGWQGLGQRRFEQRVTQLTDIVAQHQVIPAQQISWVHGIGPEVHQRPLMVFEFLGRDRA